MKTHWRSLTPLYLDEKDCLASFVVWQAAEVILNAKPANMINVFNRELSCGRNLYALWNKYSDTVLSSEGLNAFELKDNQNKKLVMLYCQKSLAKVLKKRIVKKNLSTLGYRFNSVIEALEHLKSRMGEESFPHEIGFFLGYPVKDVLGFMGLVDLPMVGTGPWKIYGNLEASLSTLKKHRFARKTIIDSLEAGSNPLTFLENIRDNVPIAA